jgi:hypothetical protein
VTVTLTARVKQAYAVQSEASNGKDVVVARNAPPCSINLFCEYNSVPPTTQEIKPGTPQWKFEQNVVCTPADRDVITSSPTPQEWTTGENLSGTSTVRSTKVGEWQLTYTAKVRFPKLKKQDGTSIRDANGEQIYFGPYTVTVLVSLKVVDTFQITGIDFQENYDINNITGNPIVTSSDYEWTETRQEPVVYKMQSTPKIKIRIKCTSAVLNSQKAIKLYCSGTSSLSLSFGDENNTVNLNFQNGVATTTMTAKSKVMNDIRKGTYVMDWKFDMGSQSISQIIYTTHEKPKCKAELFRKEAIDKTVGWASGATKYNTEDTAFNSVRLIQKAIKAECKRLGYKEDIGILADPWTSVPSKKGDCVTYADWMAKSMQLLGVNASQKEIWVTPKFFFTQKSQPHWLTSEGDIDEDGTLNKDTSGYTSGSAGSRGKLKNMYEDAAGRCIWSLAGPVSHNNFINCKSQTDADWFNDNKPWNVHGACECAGHWWEITFNTSPDHETEATMKKIGGPVIKAVSTSDKNKF